MKLIRTFDEQIHLITQTFSKDDMGQAIANEQKELRWASTQSIARGEFYKAAISKFQPELSFVIRKFEYEGQRYIEYNEERYKLIRVYSDDVELIELVCEKVEHDK